jgi:hypothetical protein
VCWAWATHYDEGFARSNAREEPPCNGVSFTLRKPSRSRIHTALVNGQAKIEERLARWLLMAHDRLDRDELPLRHEFLALMLSVAEARGHSRSATSGKSGAHQREAWADRGAESGRSEEDRNWPLRHPASRVPQANRLERQSLGVGKDDKNRLPASPP